MGMRMGTTVVRILLNSSATTKGPREKRGSSPTVRKGSRFIEINPPKPRSGEIYL
ncbi:MAG: hypothetical protein QOI77_271 [Blastocatellia bacterium]|jgi:hypothetical protein|nr:hypothetical protein [Blastocatellia bacterium]